MRSSPTTNCPSGSSVPCAHGGATISQSISTRSGTRSASAPAPAAPPRPAICSSTDVTTAGPSNSSRHRRNGSTQTNRSGPAPRILGRPCSSATGWGGSLACASSTRPPGSARFNVAICAVSHVGPDRLDPHARQTDLALVVPDPHRRALSVRRLGRRRRRHLVAGRVQPAGQVGGHAQSLSRAAGFPYSTAVISASSLVDRATADTGLSDLGLDGWQVGLEQLLAAAVVDLPDDASRAVIETAAANRLSTRLRIEQWYAEHARRGAPGRGPRDHRRPAAVGDDRAAPPAGARPAVPLSAGLGARQPHAAARSRARARRPAPTGRHHARTRRPPHLRRRRPDRGQSDLRPALPRPGARLAAADLHPVVARRGAGDGLGLPRPRAPTPALEPAAVPVAVEGAGLPLLPAAGRRAVPRGAVPHDPSRPRPRDPVDVQHDPRRPPAAPARRAGARGRVRAGDPRALRRGRATRDGGAERDRRGPLPRRRAAPIRGRRRRHRRAHLRRSSGSSSARRCGRTSRSGRCATAEVSAASTGTRPPTTGSTRTGSAGRSLRTSTRSASSASERAR